MGFKVELARGNSTKFGGICLIQKVVKNFGLRHLVKHALPEGPKFSKTAYDKLNALVSASALGADCLEDMDDFSKDPAFAAAIGKVFVPACYGGFLRAFKPVHADQLNLALKNLAFRFRQTSVDDRQFILDIDSTSHRQYSRRMEGLGYDYAGVYGLSSIQAYDQYGLLYWNEVREGNAHTSVRGSYIVDKVFRSMPRKYDRIVRADSGYSNLAFINACMDKNANFVVCMKANMYQPLLRNNYLVWRDAKRLYDAGLGQDKVEIANTIYQPEKSRRAVRVVIIRRPRRGEKYGQLPLFEDEKYSYHAWMTSYGQHQMQAEEVVLFYRKRGNAENFIREQKNGYDLHHFPCQRLLANKIYGVIVAMAQNIVRFFAIKNANGKSISYAKKTRLKMFYLPCKVVKRGRSYVLKFCKPYYQEVTRWLEELKTLRMVVLQ